MKATKENTMKTETICLCCNEKMTLKHAEELTGSLSDPSKMPAYSYGIPAEECNTGSKLVNVPGSVCENCYALKGFYLKYKKTIKPAQYNRLEKLLNNPHWVDAMIFQIRKKCANVPFFRWHDSGDLQNVDHLRKIVAIAVALPEVNFWLPTREYAFVKEYLASGAVFPKNLTVRLSAHMKDGLAPEIAGLPTSEVHTKDNVFRGIECIARYQDDKCGDCRKCWNASVVKISYFEH